MKIIFLTLFPKLYENFINESIIKNAVNANKVEFETINWRNFSKNKHHKVDDKVYGGGSGMLLMVEPIDIALKKVTNGIKVLLSPQGIVFNQKIANQLAIEKEITLIAGHYEGFDERVRSLVDMELSIGDYVLTGGELPSMVVADSIVRLIPDVINKNSVSNDSFQKNQFLLDYPQYTRPYNYNGKKVPEVLLSGNHKKIEQWKIEMSHKKTKQNRPDLWKEFENDK